MKRRSKVAVPARRDGLSAGRSIQICGTGSGVGKSLIVTGLCRIFLQDGYKTAPFKAQNMALNSFVTDEQGEIGRAQATQAQACRITPSVDMNPILIKPTSDIGAQIIVRGKPHCNMNAGEYTRYKSSLKKVVQTSFRRLVNKYEMIIIEGAGSPAEINLKSNDIVNMKMAAYAKAPVILVGDIDKGGVFAWIVGTLSLLTKHERKMVKGIIINKFRGDKTLLAPAITYLEKKTGIKVLGVVPYVEDIKIPEEDSVCLETSARKRKRKKNSVSRGMTLLRIAVIHLPHISNFTDFDAFEKEPDAAVRYIKDPDELNNSDIIIIPGTKNTLSDLKYLKDSGLADKITSIIDRNATATLVGICGGYQMLGDKIFDPHSLESNDKEIDGLGILPVVTHLEKDKTLTQVIAIDTSSGLKVSGYEIHHGSSRCRNGCQRAVFEVIECNGKKGRHYDGTKSMDGRVFGTYIHGIFDTDGYRRHFLNIIREKKGWPPLSRRAFFDTDKEFNKLAKLLREHIDLDLLYSMVTQAPRAGGRADKQE